MPYRGMLEELWYDFKVVITIEKQGKTVIQVYTEKGIKEYTNDDFEGAVSDAYHDLT